MHPMSCLENTRFLHFISDPDPLFTIGSYAFPGLQSFSSSSSTYNYHLQEGTDTTTHDKALTALKNHKEAEKRRRERINVHLDKLRGLLPCNSKMDKASLLAKVIQRVRDLKQQTSQIPGLDIFPSESDEVTVVSGECSSDGQLIFKASFCCEDRSDLILDLIEILKSLHLRTVRLDTVTLGGRIKNVLIVAADKAHGVESVNFLQNSLKSLLERTNSCDRSKRRRVFDRHLGLQ